VFASTLSATMSKLLSFSLKKELRLILMSRKFTTSITGEGAEYIIYGVTDCLNGDLF
jgi:hypothetical protein